MASRSPASAESHQAKRAASAARRRQAEKKIALIFAAPPVDKFDAVTRKAECQLDHLAKRFPTLHASTPSTDALAVHARKPSRHGADIRAAEKGWGLRFEEVASARWTKRAYPGPQPPVKEVRAESMKRMVQFATLPQAATAGSKCCHLPDRRKPESFLLLALDAMRTATGPRASASAGVGPLLPQFVTEPETVAIFCDSFWWVWLEHFALDKSAESRGHQEHLFSRIAAVYARLFSRVARDPSASRDKPPQDQLFQINRFPQLLAQALYSCYYRCFPDSRRDAFGSAFRRTLLDTLSEWITGIRALPKASHFWATTVLEGDPDSGASTTDVLDNEVSPPQKAGGHNRVRLEADYCADTREYVLFNTWGNSPLFARHLHDIQIPTPTHASIVERVQYRE
eukprot:m.205217 g.205217  ORF g.205217 m.205217 type:complete len:399 (+) comp15402_c0_seq2:161-1357(+)